MASRTARRSATPPASLAAVGERVVTRVDDLLAAEQERWSGVDPDLEHPISSLRALIAAGGKRLRPAFCHWAFVGAGGDADNPVVVDGGSALELLHTFALVHDDIMDGSERRRGMASVHTAFIEEHVVGRWRGEPRRFGEGAAVLVGDLAFVYADLLLHSASPAARKVFDELRIELCVGQYLDLVGTVRGDRDIVRARRIERYKSGKYTVERPLHFGAALADRLDDLAPALSAVGLPLGDAFQLRDDILGVFGDAAATGKPVGDDLREGKLTPLLAAGVELVGGRSPDPFARVGAADLTETEVHELQAVFVECGALDVVEQQIAARVEEALDALRELPVTREAREALADLAVYVAWRSN